MPSDNATEEAHANFLCRLWDFERPRPQIPIPRHRKVFVVVCCCVYKEPGRGARARHAARWLLGALEEAGRTFANAVHGARERRKKTYFTVKDSAMIPRPTHRNTKGICAFTPARERNPTGPQSHPGGRGRAAVARCRGGRRLSARGPRHLSARDPRRLSACGPRHLSARGPRRLSAPSPRAPRRRRAERWRAETARGDQRRRRAERRRGRRGETARTARGDGAERRRGPRAERWRGPHAERRRGSHAERWRGPRAERRRPPRQRATAARPRPPGCDCGPVGFVPGRA